MQCSCAGNVIVKNAAQWGCQSARLEEAVAFLGVRGKLMQGLRTTEPPVSGLRPSTVESHGAHSWVHLPLSYSAQWQSSAAEHLARHASSSATLHMAIFAEAGWQEPETWV